MKQISLHGRVPFSFHITSIIIATIIVKKLDVGCHVDTSEYSDLAVIDYHDGLMVKNSSVE